MKQSGRLKAWRSWVACVAAYMIFVQALATSAAMARAPVTPDGVALIICTHDGAVPDPAAPDHSSHQMDCCGLGCPMLGGFAVLPTAGEAIEPISFVIAPSEPATLAGGPLGRSQRQPRQSRAPPAL